MPSFKQYFCFGFLFCIETVMCIPGWSQTHSAAETALNFWSSHLNLPNAKIKEVCSHTWASNSTHTLLLHNRLLKKAMGLARPKTERKIFIPQYGTGMGPQVLSPKPPSHLHCPWLTSHPSSPPSTKDSVRRSTGIYILRISPLRSSGTNVPSPHLSPCCCGGG